jgi:hypothetical protein
MDYQDTHLVEPDEEQFWNTSEKILKLSDELAEQIILENIGTDLDEKLDALRERVNYVKLFKEKYSAITPDDDYYDKDYMEESLERVSNFVSDGIKAHFGVILGTGLDYNSPDEYLENMDTLYEFLFVRHFENLVDYFTFKLQKDKNRYLDKYGKLIQNDTNSKDLFVAQSRKKFKNPDDVVILHFMNEIIDDIRSESDSAYLLFKQISELDLFEEYNYRMSELLIDYGNKIVINDDSGAAKLYMAPLDDANLKNELKNIITMSYLEGCELNEDDTDDEDVSTSKENEEPKQDE